MLNGGSISETLQSIPLFGGLIRMADDVVENGGFWRRVLATGIAGILVAITGSIPWSVWQLATITNQIEKNTDRLEEISKYWQDQPPPEENRKMIRKNRERIFNLRSDIYERKRSDAR